MQQPLGFFTASARVLGAAGPKNMLLFPGSKKNTSNQNNHAGDIHFCELRGTAFKVASNLPSRLWIKNLDSSVIRMHYTQVSKKPNLSSWKPKTTWKPITLYIAVYINRTSHLPHPLSFGQIRGFPEVHLQKLGNVRRSSSVGQASQQFQERWQVPGHRYVVWNPVIFDDICMSCKLERFMEIERCGIKIVNTIIFQIAFGTYPNEGVGRLQSWSKKYV